MSYDLDILARTIYGEARGEPIDGKIAVANVVLNRTRIAQELFKERGKVFSHLFGNGTVAGACLRPYQFSCWNEKDPNSEKVKKIKASDLYFAECITVAKMALAGLCIDNTQGSTHYHVTSIGFPPSWKGNGEPDKEPVVIIGSHSFYNNIK